MDAGEVTLNRQLIIGLLLLPFSANGGVYRWVDENQQTHFGNVPPKQQSEYRVGDIDAEPASKPAATEGVASDKSTSTTSSSTASPVTIPVTIPVTTSTDSTTTTIAKPSGSQKLEELERLIQRLRAESKQTPSGNKTIPKQMTSSQTATAVSPVVSGKGAGLAVSMPAPTEPSVTAPVSSKPGLPQPVSKAEKTSPQAGTAKSTTPQDGEEKKSAKDAEMCGVFRGFMQSYQQKVKEGCPGAHCPVYQRQLKKYQLKVKRYCE